MTSLTSKITASVAALLLSAVAATTQATPADARVSAGDISLKVEATCGQGLGDSIKSLAVWTPEKGNKVVKNDKGNKATIDFGTFKKKDRGNTFFNGHWSASIQGKPAPTRKSTVAMPSKPSTPTRVKKDAFKITYP